MTRHPVSLRDQNGGVRRIVPDVFRPTPCEGAKPTIAHPATGGESVEAAATDARTIEQSLFETDRPRAHARTAAGRSPNRMRASTIIERTLCRAHLAFVRAARRCTAQRT